MLALCDNIKNPVVEDVIPNPETTDEAAAAADGNSDGAPASKKDYSEVARNMFRARLMASISREMLKLGSSRAEKAAAKEFVKVLTTLSPSSWIKKELVS